ncbi:putative methyltransferase [Lipomyces doorenjongii]|uniref:putative methyltransferase n=1 Tax=Lipomyces doorenjongii TaxID=383834 RepID=UPI0034CEE3FF
MVWHGPVEAVLIFYDAPADGAAPFNYVEERPEGQPQRNYEMTTMVVVAISDIRGQEDQISLDRDAFRVLRGINSQTTYETFNSDEEIRQVYYPEVENLLLQQVPGAHTIILFDHTIRRVESNAARQPVNQAHANQTTRSAELRLRRHIADQGKEADELLRGRYRIINVWRPINGTVESSPLAFASATTTSDVDFVAIEQRYPDFNGEIMGVKYNPAMEWKYCSGLENNERVLLKCSDTQAGVVSRVAHSAFVDPRTAVNAKGRESIEVRALVFG